MFEYRYDSFGNTAGTTMYGGGDEKAATTYTYDAAGNLSKKAAPDGTTEYTYTAQNKLKTGKTEDGQSSPTPIMRSMYALRMYRCATTRMPPMQTPT